MAAQGIGARVPRKEDARYLEGRGSFVSDMLLPGQSEVAFLRSPVAHGRVLRVAKPQGLESSVFIWDDLVGVKPITAASTLPGYKVSKHYPPAHGKVRFVGELIALVVAPSRAEAEDIAERIDIEIDELPAIIDAHAARANATSRVHDEWNDNLFLTLEYENGFEPRARDATVIVEREVTMARQAMVPLEGKAVVAYWDERADQLVLYTSTQVPHMIRIGLAETLGLAERCIRVVAPDVGGGFGYKCVLHPEEICVAWLALTYCRPFRYIEDRREHLVAGANARQHHYKLKGYADARGRLLALDAEITIVHDRSRAGPGDG